MDGSNSMHPNDQLRQERIARNWRQQDLADRVGTTVVTVTRWERGNQQPSAYFRVKLCALFGKSAEELGLIPETASPAGVTEVSASEEHLATSILPEEAPLYGQEAEASGKVQKKTPLLSRRLLVGGIAGFVTAGTTAYVLWNIQSNSAPSQRATTLSHNTSTRFPKNSPLPTLPSIGTRVFTYSRHGNYVYSIKWSSNNKRIVSASEDKTVHVWNALDGSNFLIYRGQTTRANEAAWSPDDALIVSAASDPSVQLWHAVNGSTIYTYTGHKAAVFTAKWSPDGKRIASGGLDETVQVWEASDGGTRYTYTGHRNIVNKVNWSPNGKYIASASTDQTVHVWNAADGGNTCIYKGHTARVFMAVWSPDGKRLASVGDDQTVQLWNVDDGGTIHVYRGHKDAVMAVTWSPDGKRLASASIDKTVQVWDATDGSNVFTYTGHTGGVFDVAWSHDGKYIASSGDNQDQTVQIWYAETSDERSLG